MSRAVDLRVNTGNPKALDETIQHLGAAVVDGSWDGATCLVRCLGNADWIRFAITNQGYAEIVGEEPIAMPDGEM